MLSSLIGAAASSALGLSGIDRSTARGAMLAQANARHNFDLLRVYNEPDALLIALQQNAQALAKMASRREEVAAQEQQERERVEQERREYEALSPVQRLFLEEASTYQPSPVEQLLTD